MTNWALYEARLRKPGNTARDRIIGREIDAIMSKYLASPALKEVVVADRSQKLLIHSTDIPSEKTFNTLPGEIVNLGDIVLWQKMHWLITQIDFDDEITRRGRMVQCNRQIRWQNRSTGEIIERWCLATKPYTSNISEGMAIANSNREFKIQLTYDAETILVDLDHRFLLEVIDGTPKAYQVTSVDTLTNRYEDIDGGFLVWNLKQCEYNPGTDNADLMIADYLDKRPAPTPAPPLLECRIEGRDTIRVGSYRVYKPWFYGIDGENTEDVTPVWSCTTKSEYVSYEEKGRTLIVRVDDDSCAEGDTFIIGLCDDSGVYAASSLKVEVTAFL